MKYILLLISMFLIPSVCFAGEGLDEQCDGQGYMLYNQTITSVAITNLPYRDATPSNKPMAIITAGGNSYVTYINKEYDYDGNVIEFSGGKSLYEMARVALTLGKKVNICRFNYVIFGLTYA